MDWTEHHGPLLAAAFGKVLGAGASTPGSVAFVRCLTPDVVKALAMDEAFALSGWQVWMVADHENSEERTITADHAVEIRETRGDAVLLLVDTERAGAGMDGIYSAAREVNEEVLFREARRLALGKIKKLSLQNRQYADQAAKKAQGRGGKNALSPWAEFDFFCRIAEGRKWSGAYLHLLGLWPIQDSGDADFLQDLQTSRMFVDLLLGTDNARLAPALRIETLGLEENSETNDLERFLHAVDTKPRLQALQKLSENAALWIGNLRIKPPTQLIQSIELISWRNRNGTIAKWSGLIEDGDKDDLPALILDPNADKNSKFSNLEVRWKANPAQLEKNAARYRVIVETDQGESLANQEIVHSARKNGEKARFTNDDFQLLDENSLLSARVVVEVVIKNSIERQRSEEFVIRFGDVPGKEIAGVGTKVRTFSEGLAELENRENASEIIESPSIKDDSKGFLLLRTPVYQGRRKSFRVFRPSLIADTEDQWIDRQGEIGRWKVRVRASGDRAACPDFVPFAGDDRGVWERVIRASRSLAQCYAKVSAVGQIYDEKTAMFPRVQEYMRAWTELLHGSDPLLALANTVEIQSLSERTIGLIVLPFHPLRIAWHAAYDNLVLHTAFEQAQSAKNIRDEFKSLDGAMFPAFLPNPDGGAFVFADTLGFHAVGMVPDVDKEPKAAVAILARALDDNEAANSGPTTGSQSAKILTDEIVKYRNCHHLSRLMHIHALRAGDGLTVTRSLGGVHRHYQENAKDADQDSDHTNSTMAPVFSLDLYPSNEQRGVAGRFIAEASEKRRSRAGILAEQDRWMLESLSLPGGINMPRLRWARKEQENPDTAAHMAIAFNTFESRVTVENETGNQASNPLHAFGLLSFYERQYSSLPSPVWISFTSTISEGEKHPLRRTHTESLMRLQKAVQDSVSRHIGKGSGLPALKTEISSDKADTLAKLHRLCDWVVTLDRNAGTEYFDSPQDNQEIYDAYVIDCVPEREDLGCLQLITSTANLEEVRNLLDGALDQMGLSRSRRNAEFLLGQLKALSGRLAIRLIGQRPVASELIALAMSHANCRNVSEHNNCWFSLKDGFVVPVDDIANLLPPLIEGGREDTNQARPDLIYVTTESRKGLAFRFVEVKYRRHLRSARSPDILSQIDKQTQTLRENWEAYYCNKDLCAGFRAIRRAKLARVLRFYADKAHRHYLPSQRHRELIAEINRMIERGGDYNFTRTDGDDRGWVFCPEYSGSQPLKISPDHYATQIFLFGPGLLPDADSDSETFPSEQTNQQEETSSTSTGNNESSADELVSQSEETPEAATDAESTSNTNQPQPNVQLSLGKDIYTNAGVEWRVGIDGNPHLLIAGLPGMGKTTCLVNLCQQMVAAGMQPIVFSYHQDIDQRLGESINNIRFVDFDGLGFNPLQVIDRKVQMAHLDVAGAVRDIFAAIYPELGDLQTNRIRQAIKESFKELGWTSGNEAAPEPEFKRFVEILKGTENPDRGLRTLLARLEELDDYGFFDTGDGSQGSLWESERPTIIRIHTTQNDNLQRAFAYLIFYGLYKDMFRRGMQQRITHSLILDEAHRAARLKLVPTMAKECRKYGISLVLASQEARDFDVSIFSAVANYLVLRSTDADAKFLVKNVSNSKQEKMLIDKIKHMERFKALYFAEGRTRPSQLILTPS